MPGVLPALECSIGGPPIKVEEKRHQPGDHTKKGATKHKTNEQKTAGKVVKDWSKREIIARFQNLEEQCSDCEQSEDKEQEAAKIPGRKRSNKALQRKR